MRTKEIPDISMRCASCRKLVFPYDIEYYNEPGYTDYSNAAYECCGTWTHSYDGVNLMPWGPFGRLAPYKEPKLAPVPSPIEDMFWAAYKTIRPRDLRGLVQQYRVGPYRIDFALPRQKFGIELDGLRSHASTQAMANDRARERYLFGQGWFIVRFGGLEVYNNSTACVRQAAILARTYRRRR